MTSFLKTVELFSFHNRIFDLLSSRLLVILNRLSVRSEIHEEILAGLEKLVIYALCLCKLRILSQFNFNIKFAIFPGMHEFFGLH